DDNFASIVSAVEEGRIIYSNIRKFTIYLVSCNIGEILIILIAMIFSKTFGGFIPLLAIHLLWINLMTDSFPAFALGMEEGEKNIMDQKPRDTKEQILNKPTLIKVIIQGIGLMIAALISFKIGLVLDTTFATTGIPAQARTMIFVTVVFGELFRTYSARSETKFIVQTNPFANKAVNYAVFLSVGLLALLVYVPALANIFSIEALTFKEAIIAISLGFIPMLFGELTKVFKDKI
ncbi:MAG: cation-transporting P-type ATPase, partial [Tenericutes bacterium]|nr:cation-transporting P-type ATPase [Mycoplasmatota bacterium]